MQENKQIKDIISPKRELKLGERSFQIKPINLAGISDFQQWCLDKKRKEMINLYKELGDKPDIKEIMNIRISEEDYQESMTTIEGIIFLLEKVINDNNNEKVDKSFIRENLNLDNVQEIVELIMADFLDEVKKEEKEDEGKKK